MTYRRTAILAASLPSLFAAALAAGPCAKPDAPEISLDPASATQADMAQAFKTFRAFERDSGAYRDCLKTAELPGGPEEAEQLSEESLAEVRKLQQDFKTLVDAIRSRGGAQ